MYVYIAKYIENWQLIHNIYALYVHEIILCVPYVYWLSTVAPKQIYIA